jgi:hypothetical protein
VPKADLSASVDSIVDPPRRRGVAPPSRWAGERSRLWIWVVTVVAVLGLGVGIPVFSEVTGPGGMFGPTEPTEPAVGGIPVVRLPAPDLSNSTPEPSGGPGTTAPSAARSSSAPPAPTPTRSGPGAPAPVPAQLRAHYETIGQLGTLGIDGYEGQVTVSNPGRIEVTGWTVTLTLPSGEVVSGASGVHFRQDGTTVTFTPIGRIKSVPAQGSVRFTFTVRATFGNPPTDCSIDGQPCS